MNMPNWEEVERPYLREKFITGKITQASRRDLERALVVLAHAGEKDPWPKETENFRSTVTQLLQVRVSEELFRRSVLRSWIAIGISILAVFLTGWQTWEAHCARVAASHSTASAPPPTR
ncbi:MAG: hypothetical protein HZA91_20915 [Verrucomicrobia bacterium]|nr:hypothetical protein [Verrucomicrobiota bacterium]